jgi:molybdenum cofactor cytidylyltransferase
MPEAPPFRLGAVVLAAGRSSRMGEVKQLLEVEGRTLLARAAGAALEAGARPVMVVLGANAALVRAGLGGLPVDTVVNAGWSSGMASSIRVGVAALLAAAPALDAILVAPCDQPALSAEVIRHLARLSRSTGRIGAARYGGRVGAPAVFGRGDFAALQELRGDEGARGLLNGSPEKVAAADFPELAADLDSPGDYDSWTKGARGMSPGPHAPRQ